MRQRPDRDEIHSCFSDRTDTLERDASGSFDFAPVIDKGDRIPHQLRPEIIQHNPLYTGAPDRLANFIKR